MKYVSLFIFLLIFSMNFSFPQDKNSNPFDLIEKSFEADEISFEEALLQKFYYAFDKEKLDKKYLAKTAGPMKCGTGLVREFRENKSKLSDDAIDEIENYLNRPFNLTEGTFKYTSPSGKFELTYLTTGTNAVPLADSNSNTVPDFVEWIADYFDYSWDFTVGALGYLAPPIGAGKYQIGFEEMDYYGYTDFVSGKLTRIVMHRDFLGFPPNTDPEGGQKGAAKATAIHEFKHAVQFVYNSWNDPGWFIEMDATWMEDIGYDDVNDYYNYLRSSQLADPSRSFTQGSGYEDCLWLHYISEKHGVLSNRKIWERRSSNKTENIFNNFDFILQEYSSSFEKGIRDFFVWNFSTGKRADGLFETYGEADKYPSVYLCRDINELPDSNSGCGLNSPSANYFYYKASDLPKFINLIFNSGAAVKGGFEILLVYKNNTSERLSIDLNNQNSLNHLLLKKLDSLLYFIVIPVRTSTTGNLVDYTLKITPFTTAEFIFNPLKDSEESVEKLITTKVITEYNIAFIDSLKLFYSINGIDFISLKMIPTGMPDEFSAAIPAVPAGITVSYYFSIFDTLEGYLYHPYSAPAIPFYYSIGPDTISPEISHTEIINLNKYNFPLSFFAEVDDNIQVDSVYGEFTINDSEISQFTFQKLSGNIYKGRIDSLQSEIKKGDNFQYRIIAVDGSNNHNKKSYPLDDFISVTASDGYEFTSIPQKIIRDNYTNGIRDTIIVPGDLNISDLNLIIKITHSRLSDIKINIKPPFRTYTQVINVPWLGILFENSESANVLFDQDAYFSVKKFFHEDSDSIFAEVRPDTTNFNFFNGLNAKGRWILQVIDLALGETGVLNEWKLIFGSNSNITEVAEDNIEVKDFALNQNYPNPFNPSTLVRYTIPTEVFVELKVFDILGRETATLVNEVQTRGSYEINFNADNLSSGIYFYRIRTGNFSSTKKMILIR